MNRSQQVLSAEWAVEAATTALNKALDRWWLGSGSQADVRRAQDQLITAREELLSLRQQCPQCEFKTSAGFDQVDTIMLVHGLGHSVSGDAVAS